MTRRFPLVMITTLFVLASCVGVAPVVAQEPCDGANYLNDTYIDGSSYGSGNIYGVLWIPSADWVITRIEIFTGENTGPVGFALWSDDGGTPSHPLANLGNTEYVTTSTTNSWQGADLLHPVSVQAGTTYWIIIHPLSAMQTPDEPGGTIVRHWWNNTGTITGPLTWSWSGPWDSTHWKYRLFGFAAEFSVGGEILEVNTIHVLAPAFVLAFTALGTAVFLRRKRLP